MAANFAGIPLAFAFIATLGTIGIVTQLPRPTSASTRTTTASRSSRKTGVELVYLYFQIPLMILVIAPAIDGLRREWREAAANLGATPRQFWRYVGLPVLTPSLLGAVVLLFGNSFAAYATAYGADGRLGVARADHDRLLPLRRRPLEPAPRRRRSRSGCSSCSRVMMAIYIPLQRISSRWVR